VVVSDEDNDGVSGGFLRGDVGRRNCDGNDIKLPRTRHGIPPPLPRMRLELDSDNRVHANIIHPGPRRSLASN